MRLQLLPRVGALFGGGTWKSASIVAIALAYAYATGATAQSDTPRPSTFPPPQLEMRVPFEPMAFPSGGQTYLIYELYLRNFAPVPYIIRRIEVLDADETAKPLATFEGTQLDEILQPVGEPAPSDANGGRRQVAGGRSVVLFLSIGFERGASVPARLRHRLLIADAAIEGTLIGTHATELPVLGPPLIGPDWAARSGPTNDSYHRRGILVLNGAATIDRRYAIDWVRSLGGQTFAGDEHDLHSYYAYGEPVLAVADGRLVSVKDGIPDNVPGHTGFRPAVPLTMETLAGNTITLDVGGGHFAYYMHLQPGSVRVKSGDKVRRGDALGRVGNSGDAREPHLHFEVTNSSHLLVGEGVPYVIDRYRAKAADDSWRIRTREFPWRDDVFDFGQAGRGK
jgi:Peptidase family M23